MHILIANDDGLHAPGIRLLSERLVEHSDQVTVVAPDRDRSGASNSLTLDQPIRVEKRRDGVFKVFGTPTDCVHIAITGLLGDEPDMVVSGINAGANLGDDVLYSGTVAAAMEGRFLGLPAMAVSLVYSEDGPRYYDSAAEAACMLMAQLQEKPLPADTILNVSTYPTCRGKRSRASRPRGWGIDIDPKKSFRSRTRAGAVSSGSVRPVPRKTTAPGPTSTPFAIATYRSLRSTSTSRAIRRSMT